MTFTDVLQEVGSTELGKKTIAEVNRTWDKQSQQALWTSPQLLKVMHEQRENGIYDTIVAELDRQKMLGNIPASTPFIEAYKQVGDKLYPPQPAKVDSPAPVAPAKVLVDQKAAPTKKPDEHADKAKAAATPPSNQGKKAKGFVNPLEMADDEFLKTFKF